MLHRKSLPTGSISLFVVAIIAATATGARVGMTVGASEIVSVANAVHGQGAAIAVAHDEGVALLLASTRRSLVLALSEAFFISSSLMNIWHTIQAANRTPIDIHMNAWLNS